MVEAELRNYAELLVNGGNVQGKPVLVSCNENYRALCYLVVDVAFDAGASDVKISWYDENCKVIKLLQRHGKVSDDYQDWIIKKVQDLGVEDLVCLRITPPDADLAEEFEYPKPPRYKGGIDEDIFREYEDDEE